MIVVHTSFFDESTELEEMLKIFEQKQDLTQLHLQHLKNDEDWDEALDLIIKADRIISIWDVFPYFESFNKLILFYKDSMGLFQSPQNVETNKMRSWEVQLQDGTKVTVKHRLDCIGDTCPRP